MPTYKATATATASVTAQFFFRKEEVVTASGSATAESDISQEDAYNTALSIAKEVAQSAAQNDANVLIQSVNTSTLGDNTLFLSSSLLKDYLDRDGNNYTLIKDLELPSYFRVIVGRDETFNIGEDRKFKATFTNYGTFNTLRGSEVTAGGIRNAKTNPFSKYIKKGATSASDTTQPSSNSGTQTVSSGSTFYVTDYTFNNEPTNGIGVNFYLNKGAILSITEGGIFNNISTTSVYFSNLYIYGSISYDNSSSNTLNNIGYAFLYLYNPTDTFSPQNKGSSQISIYNTYVNSAFVHPLIYITSGNGLVIPTDSGVNLYSNIDTYVTLVNFGGSKSTTNNNSLITIVNTSEPSELLLYSGNTIYINNQN